MARMLKTLFKPNATKRLFAEAIRAILDEIAKPPAERKPIDFVALSGGKPGWFPRMNSIGRLWLQRVMPDIEGLLSHRVQSDLQLSFTRALIALKCHKISNGQLPDSLDALVPEYFGQMPIDPYDGKPLKCSREKKILRSVGKDFEEALDDDTEPVCRIEF